MKQTVIFFITVFSPFNLLFAELTNVELESEIALLMNMDTRRILYQKNADQITAPASITKVATALYTLNEVGDDVKVKVKADQDCIGSITAEMQKSMEYKHPPHWLVIGGTHMSIKKGEEPSLEELLYGLMLVSANDAANMIAKYVGGSISQFMADLNDYLESIGCSNTHFRNPHGLHLPKHYTTALDMGLITCEAMKHPLFRKIIATDKYSRPSLDKGKSATIFNSNLLVRPGQKYFYPYALGGKTGNHTEAKRSLVAVASHKGRNLVAVLIQSPTTSSSFEDARILFDTAFSEDEVEEVYLAQGQQPFSQYVAEGKKNLKTFLHEDLKLSYFPSEKPNVKGEIFWLDNNLPISKGDTVATLTLKDEDGMLLKEVSLQASHKIALKSKVKRFAFYVFLIFCVTLLFIVGNYAFSPSSREE
ncbi:MAG: D-alanyl-D-alanine carboxypeptidase DacF [Chlamydiae bacterium]|nr:D-alanyl-D-alanine carboxypeptidase DacF [Chlamydiota bacterium]